jgi:anti-sigma B factor antagonist
MLQLETRQADDAVLVIEAEGNVDLTNANQLEAALRQASDRKPEVIALDMAHVDFMDTSAVAAILRARNRLSADGVGLAILRPHPMPRFFLRRTHLDRAVPIVESVEEAVERTNRLTREPDGCRDAAAVHAEASQRRNE